MNNLFYTDFAALEERVLAHMIVNAEATDQALDEAMVEREVHTQAIEAFMDERSDLLSTIRHLSAVKDDQARAISALVNGVAARPQAIDTLGAENAKLRQDVAAMESVTLRAANFVDTLRTRLAAIGVTFEMNELGEPDLTVNALELANFMYAHMQAQAAG
jgi:hypothetical protein